MKLITRLTLCLVIGFSLQANAALVARDLDGNFTNGHEAVYDTVLDITWLADVNIASSEKFGVEAIALVDDGRMFWGTAIEYMGAMNNANSGLGYLGINTWRLPNASAIDGLARNLDFGYDGSTDAGFNIGAPIDPLHNPYGQSEGFLGNELMYHYYVNFGGQSPCAQTVPNPTVVGDIDCSLDGSIFSAADLNNYLALFHNQGLGLDSYWIGKDLSEFSALTANMTFGQTIGNAKVSGLSVWAVADGDVGSPVPLPSSGLLFLAAVMALLRLK